jgi:hypothetical protein
VVLALLFTLCGLVVPAAASTVPVSIPLAQVAPVVRPAAIATASNGSTSVPPGNTKKGVRLGPILWAVPAVAVLCAAVATPLALRRYRERSARHRAGDGG